MLLVVSLARSTRHNRRCGHAVSQGVDHHCPSTRSTRRELRLGARRDTPRTTRQARCSHLSSLTGRIRAVLHPALERSQGRTWSLACASDRVRPPLWHVEDGRGTVRRSDVTPAWKGSRPWPRYTLPCGVVAATRWRPSNMLGGRVSRERAGSHCGARRQADVAVSIPRGVSGGSYDRRGTFAFRVERTEKVRTSHAALTL